MHTFSRSQYATEEAMSNVYSHVKPIVKICTKYELGDSAEIATHKHLKLYSGKRV